MYDARARGCVTAAERSELTLRIDWAARRQLRSERSLAERCLDAADVTV